MEQARTHLFEPLHTAAPAPYHAGSTEAGVFWHLGLGLALLVVWVMGGAGVAFAAMPEVKVKLVADRDAAVPGQTLRVGVLMDIEPGWHIYWHNPGDTGMATVLRLAGPEGEPGSPEFPGVEIGDFAWPIPERFELEGGLVNFGYKDRVMFVAEVKVPADYASEDLTLTVKADWLICRESCVPGDGSATLTLPVATTSKPADASLFDTLPVPRGVEAVSDRVAVKLTGGIAAGEQAGQYQLELVWRGEVPEGIGFFPGSDPAIANPPATVATDKGVTRITQEVKLLRGMKPGTAPLRSLVRWTEADGSVRAVSVPVHVLAQPPTTE